MIVIRSWRRTVAVFGALLMAASLLVSGCGQAPSASKSNSANSAKSSKTVPAADQQAAQRGYILIGYPSPETGALASFGQGANWIAKQCLAAINKNGGIEIKSLGKKLPVKMKMLDTQSNDAQAAAVATQLITKDKVDMMLVLHTPDTVNPVTGICERYHMPTIALDCPVESWLSGGPYHWSYLAFWTVDTVSSLYINMWKNDASKTDKVVGLLFDNSADGVSWAKVFNKKLPADGYTVVDPGRFPDSTNDFTGVISQFKKAKVQIVTGTLPPPVFATVWRQMHEQGFVPKILTMGKALLFPTDVAALGGNLPNGLTEECWWSASYPYKSSLTGETPAQIMAAYTKDTGRQPTATIGYDYAGWDLVNDVLTRAGTLDPNVLVKAIGSTDLNTVVGPIKFNSQHYAPTPVVGGQWVKGTKWPWVQKIVDDQAYPQIPTNGKMIFPLPK